MKADVWTRYVRSVVRDLGISNGKGKQFELGCGCLGFLEQVRLVSEIGVMGMDGSPSFLDWLMRRKVTREILTRFSSRGIEN